MPSHLHPILSPLPPPLQFISFVLLYILGSGDLDTTLRFLVHLYFILHISEIILSLLTHLIQSVFQFLPGYSKLHDFIIEFHRIPLLNKNSTFNYIKYMLNIFVGHLPWTPRLVLFGVSSNFI